MTDLFAADLPLDLPSPSRQRTLALTVLALLAFAGNSLLCRWALDGTDTDPASFTALRLFSGALVLALLVHRPGRSALASGNAVSGFALFAYAACFSYAYLGLSAGTGALLLFGAVQATMLAVGLARGTRWSLLQAVGLTLALSGLVGLLLPGLSAPPPLPAALMLLAGVAWGVYSLRGRGIADPTAATAGNFIRALPWALAACLLALPWLRMDAQGAALALLSGAVTSGAGYAVWYAALGGLSPQAAGSSQLAVPVITALAGLVLLDETIGLRLVLGSLAVLGGIALTLPWRPRRPA
ncbi:MAG: DMT family transporter [Arenimonas sp.]|uniref:DMT family transporter n=1 Tax=Arenimonas sp. TaxID=1872635 RepID=UPI0025B7FC66|nr:DMT family transporter [Arenimonas sp.]MBW8367992.1 DMT family transporter [Arenimonas sp.]